MDGSVTTHRPVAPVPRRPSRHDSGADNDHGSTRERILEASLAILGRDGVQALTTRAIADQAGVNQALINYHFGTKANLFLEIVEALESGKYSRQWDMYHDSDAPLSRKWRQAVEFYRQDIADGYVRISQELYAIGYSDPAVAQRMTARVERWQALLEEVARDYLPALGIRLPPEHVASAVASFWLGMNLRVTDGESEEDGHFFAILDFIGDWIEERERQCDVTPGVRPEVEVPDSG